MSNVLSHCLCVQSGERVALLHWRAPELGAIFDEALVRAGATVSRVDLSARTSVPPGSAPATISGLYGCAASLLVAAQDLPMSLSFAARQAVQQARTRHLHLAGIDQRVLAQSPSCSR